MEKEITRDFNGVWIPKEIWLNDELGWSEKLLLVEIQSLDNSVGCYAGNDYFSKFFKLTTYRISRIIKSLEQKGYIKITYKRAGYRIERRTIKAIQAKSPIDQKVNRKKSPIDQKVNRPIDQKVKENNTLNNTEREKEKKIPLSQNSQSFQDTSITGKIDYIQNLANGDNTSELATQYNITGEAVASVAGDVLLYIEMTGKTYQNYKIQIRKSESEQSTKSEAELQELYPELYSIN
jgi:hypothetical protein